MDVIRYLLGKVLQLAVIFFIAAGLFWLLKLLYPQIRTTTNTNAKSAYGSLAQFFSFDWLPAPKNYGGLLGTRTNSDTNGKVYVPGPAYNGYAGVTDPGADVAWVYYTTNGTQVVRGNTNDQVFTGNTSSDASRSSYIRNLSIYDGMSVTYGQVMYGEAKETMFRNGAFPVVVTDTNGRILSSTQATVVSAWSAPGWKRFKATIQTHLPGNTYCHLAFYSANEPVRVSIPVHCN